MNSSEFLKIRHNMKKSQSEMARLLSISPRAVQAFEQGWRKIPPSVERQMLYLLYTKTALPVGREPCWQAKDCNLKTRKKCPAWEFHSGHVCWFINGTTCEGKVQESWNKKMQLCRQCAVFRLSFPTLFGS